MAIRVPPRLGCWSWGKGSFSCNGRGLRALPPMVGGLAGGPDDDMDSCRDPGNRRLRILLIEHAPLWFEYGVSHGNG